MCATDCFPFDNQEGFSTIKDTNVEIKSIKNLQKQQLDCKEIFKIILKKSVMSKPYKGKEKKQSLHNIIYVLLTKHEVKMAGYWPSSCFAFLRKETNN